MTSAAKKVLDDALALPADERRKVAEALLDALPPEIADELEIAWNEEVRRRVDRFERGETHARDGEEALRDLETKLRGIRGT